MYLEKFSLSISVMALVVFFFSLFCGTASAEDFLSYPCQGCSGGVCPTGNGSLACLTDLDPVVINAIEAAAQQFGLDPFILASVKYQESSTSPDTAVNPDSNATGIFQFLECTWEGWNQSGCNNSYGIADGVFSTDPNFINSLGGYGRDGDGDGLADPNNPIDSAFSAAEYFSSLGMAENPREALYQYGGGSYGYADEILARTEEIRC